MEDLSKYTDLGIELAMKFLPRLAMVVLILLIGFWLIKKVKRIAQTGLEKAKFDKGIVSFLVSMLDIAMKVFLILTTAGMIGFETASLIGVLAAASFAVGLALQGSLSNFAAGILVLVFKPYKVDHWIEVNDKFGKVEDIQIFNTIMVTPGQKTMIIPNAQVVDNIVTNYSKKGHIRIELQITMPYEESFPKVKKILEKVVHEQPKILESPNPEIGIVDFESHNIVVGVRPYVSPDDYWDVTYDLNSSIKKAFHEHNIKVAYSEGVEIGNIGQ